MVEEIYKMNDCFDKDKDNCTIGLCNFNGGKCNLLFPKINLVNGISNKTFYYLKLSDEIVRYERVKKYIFTKNIYLALEDLNYNLTNNEMLIYESELDQNYLKELSDISNKKNRLIKNIHEMIKPDKSTVMLETMFNLDDLVY